MDLNNLARAILDLETMSDTSHESMPHLEMESSPSTNLPTEQGPSVHFEIGSSPYRPLDNVWSQYLENAETQNPTATSPLLWSHHSSPIYPQYLVYDSSDTAPPIPRDEAIDLPNEQITSLLASTPTLQDVELIKKSASILVRRLRYTFSFDDANARKWKLADVYKEGAFRHVLYIRSLTSSPPRPDIDFGAGENAGIVMTLQDEVREGFVFLGQGPLTLDRALRWYKLKFRFLTWTGRDGYEWHRDHAIDMQLWLDEKEFGYEGDSGRRVSFQT